MSAFHDVSFPLPLALGASGGPERRTEFVRLGSGRETRNTPWAHGRRRYDAGGAVRTHDDLHALISFFEARRGMLHSFRFRDGFDWKSCAPSQAPSALDQALGDGDGVTVAFALKRAYGEPGYLYERPITKPQPGSVLIAIDGAPLSGGAYTVDAATGVVTFASPPALGAAITAGFLFDTHVRFDVDRLDITLDAFNAGRAVSAPLIEVHD